MNIKKDKDLVIIGLGPGGTDTLTVGVRDRLQGAEKLFIRTGKHPAAAELQESGVSFSTFDYLYEELRDFPRVYSGIAEILIKEARTGPVVYAVPGHPLVGEESVLKAIELAVAENLSYEVVPAVSFLDAVLTGLNLDLSKGLKLIDGLGLVGEDFKPASRPDPLVPNLVMQVYNSLVASEVKLSLMEFYPDGHLVKVISHAGVPGCERIEQVPLFELDRLDWIDHLTSVYIPPDRETTVMVSRFPMDSIVDILERLRDEHGCPWDREQTHQSLKKYLIEETYEVLEAIDEGNMYKICEELGDLLLQIVFHSQIARESGSFDFNDVVLAISRKIVRRHPHVFGSASVRNSNEVSLNWEEIKKGELKEKGETRNSLLEGIPIQLPALMKADLLQHKAAKGGFDWPDYRGALDKVAEETGEVKAAIASGSLEQVRNEIGDLIFAVVNLARLLQVNPEEALLLTVRKFKERFMYIEKIAAETGRELGNMGLEELDKLWEEAKIELKGKKT